VPRNKKSFDLAQGASLGLTLAGTLCLFAYLGYRIDQWLQCSPIGLIAGCLVGLAAGMTWVIRKVSDISEESNRDEPR
jgi:F0F1-type ATP synthase assembly protein I